MDCASATLPNTPPLNNPHATQAVSATRVDFFTVILLTSPDLDLGE